VRFERKGDWPLLPKACRGGWRREVDICNGVPAQQSLGNVGRGSAVFHVALRGNLPGTVTTCYTVIITWSFATLVAKVRSGADAGPRVTCPLVLNCDPWHGHVYVPPLYPVIRHP
jgi:hypothetical protein